MLIEIRTNQQAFKMLASSSLEDDGKSKSKKHSRADKDGDDDNYREKKKHKKSKKSGKDKHKDKEKSKSKKSKDKESKKSKLVEDEQELSAFEKFNMFKKQREAAKNDDGNVVDDLFKDFIASKIKQIENENDERSKDKNSLSKAQDDLMSDSVNELNKFLDEEISNISKSDKVDKADKIIKDTTTLGSLLKLDRSKKKQDFSKNKAVPNDETKNNSDNLAVDKVDKQALKGPFPNDLCVVQRTSQTEAVLESIPLPSEKPAMVKESSVQADNQNTSAEKSISDTSETTLPVFGPMLPSLEHKIEKDQPEELSTQVKKPTLGFKNFGIKLSATSAELILSGAIHKKGKRLEDGKFVFLLLQRGLNFVIHALFFNYFPLFDLFLCIIIQSLNDLETFYYDRRHLTSYRAVPFHLLF